MPKAVIVGAGINGLCTAWALVRRGWTVEVLDKGPVPNPEAASWDRHRLIRAHYAGLPGYAARLPAAFAAWDRLWRDLGRSHYVERGVLALSRSDGDWTDRSRAALDAAGAAYELLEPGEIAARFPVFEAAGVRYGLHAPRGGVLLADRILDGFAAWLRMRGAVIRERMPVARLDPAAGTAEGPAGRAAGDVLVLAAGVGLLELVPAELDGFAARRSVVLYVAPPPDLAGAWAAAPAWVDLGGKDDLWGVPAVDGIPVKIGYGLHTRPGDPATERGTGPRDVAAILGAYAGRVVRHGAFRPLRAVANFYLMAPDERFVLRRDRRALLLSADSGHGFKFGALTGEDAAEALDGGNTAAIARRLAGLEDRCAPAGADGPPADA